MAYTLPIGTVNLRFDGAYTAPVGTVPLSFGGAVGAYTIVLGAGSFSASVASSSITRQCVLLSSGTSFTYGGVSVGVSASRLALFDRSLYNHTPEITTTKVTRLLTLGSGSLGGNGFPLTLRRIVSFVLGAGVFTLAGASIGFSTSIRLSLEKADFEVIGLGVSSLVSRAVNGSSGTFVYDSQDAVLVYNMLIHRQMLIDPSEYVWVEGQMSSYASRYCEAERADTYAVNALDTGIVKVFLAAIQFAGYWSTEQSATFIKNSALVLEPGTVLYDGGVIGLRKVKRSEGATNLYTYRSIPASVIYVAYTAGSAPYKDMVLSLRPMATRILDVTSYPEIALDLSNEALDLNLVQSRPVIFTLR